LVHACVDAFRDRYDRVYATTDGSAAGEADGVGGVRCGIKVDVDPALVGGGPAVLIDEAAMTQVILNLLDNAVKYSGGVSGRPLRVDVSVGAVKCRMRIGSRSRRCVRISVRDYGIGIERRDRRRIFRPFYRSVSASRVNASGVGLGLALCRHVVVSHGGSIEVSSAVGAGSTFSVLLPLAGCSPAAGGTGSRASGEPVRPCGPHSGDPDERDGTDAGQEFVSGGAPRVNR
jgi:signal transduction histidine kinase